MRRLRCIGIINDKQRCSVWLLTNYFSAEASRRDFGSRSRRRLDHPASVQHRETQARFDNGPRFEGHPTSACDVTVERFPNALAADYLVAVNHQDGARLIERSERFNIAAIE